MRRTGGEWLADVGAFLFSALFLLVTADSVALEPGMSETAVLTEQFAGVLACAALFLRRRWPVPLAVVLLVAGASRTSWPGPAWSRSSPSRRPGRPV